MRGVFQPGEVTYKFLCTLHKKPASDLSRVLIFSMRAKFLVHCPFWTAKEVEGIVAKHKGGSSYLDKIEKEKRFQNEGCNFAEL